jgi:hypothetical protein
MSIESNISIAFYPDCNTFATHRDAPNAIVESLNKKSRSYGSIVLSSLCYWLAGEGLIELFYSLKIGSQGLGFK